MSISPFNYNLEIPVKIFSDSRIGIYGSIFNIFHQDGHFNHSSTLLQQVIELENGEIVACPASSRCDLEAQIKHDIVALSQHNMIPHLALTMPLHIAQLWHTGLLQTRMFDSLQAIEIVSSSGVKAFVFDEPVNIEDCKLLFGFIPADIYRQLGLVKGNCEHHFTYFDNDLNLLGGY